MLQGLEEELNRHREGSLRIESNFIPQFQDEELIQSLVFEKSQEWWERYKANNDCFITDALYGEICNRIQCTKCRKVFLSSPFHVVCVQLFLLQHGVCPSAEELDFDYNHSGFTAVFCRGRHDQPPLFLSPFVAQVKRPNEGA